MPRFAANLSLMFNEVPFLDRFEAAARAGFDAVEFLFPYEHSPEAVGARLRDNGLTQALFNLPPGDFAKGERGLAALPERLDELKAGVDTALRYAEALGRLRAALPDVAILITESNPDLLRPLVDSTFVIERGEIAAA